jgi:hypothetical protein
MSRFLSLHGPRPPARLMQTGMMTEFRYRGIDV